MERGVGCEGGKAQPAEEADEGSEEVVVLAMGAEEGHGLAPKVDEGLEDPGELDDRGEGAHLGGRKGEPLDQIGELGADGHGHDAFNEADQIDENDFNLHSSMKKK